VNIEKLLQLAREREARTEDALAGILLEPPDRLQRELRHYLSRQVDYDRMKRTDEKIPQLTQVQGGFNELACPDAEFSSGARLEFRIQLETSQCGWLVKRFRFHVYLAQARSIDMVRIHLNEETPHDPLTVPRCHMHIGNSRAHIPFPIMDPRLILHLICDYLEPDFGVRLFA
jgi:hypothetical protein